MNQRKACHLWTPILMRHFTRGAIVRCYPDSYDEFIAEVLEVRHLSKGPKDWNVLFVRVVDPPGKEPAFNKGSTLQIDVEDVQLFSVTEVLIEGYRRERRQDVHQEAG